MKSFGLILMILFSFLGIGQPRNVLQQTNHTFSLNKDSLTIFQEAEFYSIVPWFADTDTLNNSGNMILLEIYYKPDPFAVGNIPFTSTSKDTFSISNLPKGSHTLIIESYEHREGYDTATSSFYTYYTLRDSDTSYFQVLSDHSISFTESPISFYPNPAKEKLNLHGLKPEDGEVAVSILDMNGKEILQAQVSYLQPALTLPALPKGTYLVKTSTSSIFQKMLIE